MKYLNPTVPLTHLGATPKVNTSSMERCATRWEVHWLEVVGMVASRR